MASNIVQCVFAVLVILHPSALFSSSAHLPTTASNQQLLDNPLENVHDLNSNSGEEESNIILLNNINKKIWDASSLAPDDIRCYCNLPACVSNGYMCRTARSHPEGGCFSERLPVAAAGDTQQQQPSLPARHGCTNLLIESQESFKCDNNNHQTVPRRSQSKGPVTPRTTVMCCHEDMCNHEGTAGRREISTKLSSPQQRIKLNQQRDVASAPSSSSAASLSGASSSAAAVATAVAIGVALKNSSGAAAAMVSSSSSSSSAGAAAAIQSDDLQMQQQSRDARLKSHRGAVVVDPMILAAADSSEEVGTAEMKEDIVDSEYYQFSDNEQQNVSIKTITCVVAVFGAICVFTLLYIGIRLLSTDGSMGSSPASKLNRSDDSGHIMIGASSPEGKMTMEPKYYIAAAVAAAASTSNHGGGAAAAGTAKNLFATNVTPTMATSAYQPLSATSQQKNGKCSDKLSALEYQLLAPELVSKLEKGNGGSDGDEAATDRLLKPMISNSCSRNNNNNSNNCRKNTNSNKGPAADCNCNLAKNCRNCSTNVKFTNERWRSGGGKDNRQAK